MNNFPLSSMEMARTNVQVNEVNKKIGVNKAPEEGKQSLGKDSFLKLLVTQLKHQDPTKPAEDKEFIAQMAQFSTLEQITNMNREMKSLIRSSEASEAYGILGKKIESFNPATKDKISGVVTSVRYSEDRIVLMVGKNEISIKDVHSVFHDQEKNSK